MLSNVVCSLLSNWDKSTEKKHYRHYSATDSRWKVILVQNLFDNKYCMGVYIKAERYVDIHPEGELDEYEEELLSIINEEAVDGWLYIGGKVIQSLEYFLPDEIIGNL